MERRLLLAVTLSILVMLLYPVFLAKITPPTTEPKLSIQPIETKEVIEVEPKEQTLPIDAVYETLINDKYTLALTNIGGSINKIEIKHKGGPDVDLVSQANFQAGILSIEGKDILSGLSSEKFEIKKASNSFYLLKNSLGIEKNISFLKDRYAIRASVTITNYSNSTEDILFEITTASNISNKEQWESRYIEADVLYKDGRLKKISSSNFKNYNKLYQENIDWLMLRNKYYSIIARPDFPVRAVFTKNDVKGSGIVGFIIDEKIMPAEIKTYNFLFYIGPIDIEELEKVDRSFGKALNFGMLTSVSLILLGTLKFFYSVFHSYGLAILLLTFCVSLVLYPLTFKSLKSMKKLQELQPQMEKLRLEHKDNPQKLNKEIMELYRRYNVNPMSGCLPIFLQMPIFIALYQTLMKSIELKGASFLWIKDLSMPDAAFRLPFMLPFFGDAINILPILMIGAMIIQQKLSQTATTSLQTEQQKIMSSVMPVVFGFIFYSLPSGLVLYWLANTLLTSFLQYIFLRKI
jgi:YidC/Oxa1 family membrane protein insertase